MQINYGLESRYTSNHGSKMYLYDEKAQNVTKSQVFFFAKMNGPQADGILKEAGLKIIEYVVIDITQVFLMLQPIHL